MSARLWLSGLRTRLAVAFVLVTMVGAAAAAGSGAGSASNALVSSSESTFAGSVRDRVAAVAPTLTFPPDQASVDRLRESVGANSLVRYADLQSSSGVAADLISPDLVAAVRRSGELFTQRIVAEGKPWLLVGTQVVTTSADGSRSESGVEVFVALDLSSVERQTGDLASSAVWTAALALPFAILIALLAARSVLRPVRELRDTARRLKAGDLAARSPRLGADELAELSATINEMAESLQESMGTMARMQADSKRFVADVSHELRTPLSTLTAVVEVLADSTADMEPDARESAELALEETRRLVQLVETLIEVSRFDAGTAQLRSEDVDVASAVRDALLVRNWEESVAVVATTAAHARLDPRRLDVIVANLVGNALRHVAPPVRVTISADEAELRIDVADSGAGIRDGDLDHVFDRFFKTDASRSRSPGSGLGLAIAQENARLHGGTVTARNSPEGGAVFTLRLPLEGT